MTGTNAKPAGTQPEPTVATDRAISTGRTDGSETSVDRVGEQKLRPFHDTQDVIMPYAFTTPATASISASTSSTGQYSFGFRLNSIYDCLTTTTFTDNPAAAADTADGTVQKPLMHGYWTNIYTYWTVTRAEYKVEIWSPTKSDSGECSIWCYHNGLQQPPLLDNSGTPQIVPDMIRKMHKHCHMKRIRPHPASSTTFHEMDNLVTFTGVYYPGNRTVVNDIAEDEYKETWHKGTEVPSLREVATFIINKSDRSDTIAMSFKIKTTIIYHVQFKDLKRQFIYPVQTDDFPTMTDYPMTT